MYPKVPYLAHSFSLCIQLLLAKKIPSNIICRLMTPSCYISFTPANSALSLETLTYNFTDILSWMNLNKLFLNPSKTEFLLIGKKQHLKYSDLLDLLAMISSQSVPLLTILASSLTLTYLPLIKSTLYPNLVIFTSETSVEFLIFFIFLQPQ